jgi:hypothetical protein
MKLFSLMGTGALLFTLSSAAHGTTLDIRSVKANGSACPIGTTSVTPIDTDGDGRDDFFQVTYSEFELNRPGDTVKNCLIELVVNVPRGFQYSIFRVSNRGFADIHRYHRARLDIEYEWPFIGIQTTQRMLNGPYASTFNVSANFDTPSYSPCNMNLPLNLNSRAAILKKPAVLDESGATSELQVERTQGLFIQRFFLRWRRC